MVTPSECAAKMSGSGLFPHNINRGMVLEVRLFGQFDVRLAGQPVDLASRPAQSLLAFLLIHTGRPFRREKLAGLFWPNTSEANARNNLRQAVWRIRKALAAGPQTGPEYIVADEFTLAFNANSDYWLDVATLEQEGTAGGSVDDLIRIVSVYRGELLPGFYDEWLVPERERLQVVFERKIQLLLDRLVAEQRWQEVLVWGERWIALGHAPEPAYRALMFAYSGLGDSSGLAGAFRRCTELLRRDLGVEPSEQTRLVYERLSKGEKALIRGYELHELIGAGELGAVYRATQPLVGREVAIKVIPPQYANQPDFIRRFESEAQLIARLEHIHIRPLYDYWREPDGAYLVMRWLGGGSLRSALDRQRTPAGDEWDLPVVARLLDQIAAALAAAHRQGVVHGNLKPVNILFDTEGNAFLTDFRIAEDVGRPSGPLPSDDSVRSGDYLSPEQASGELPTPQSDQYSLAIIVYEILAGEHPQAKPTPVNQNRWPCLPPLDARRPDLPKGLIAVLQRATAENPAERYPDLLAFAAAFRNVLELAPTQSMALAIPETPAWDIVNPYKGLRAFQEADAADFFGREALIDRLLARLNERVETRRFAAVVGPSGCGKSSVVKAGLLPALRRGGLPGSEKWFVVEMMPGAHPLEELEIGLLRIAANQPAGLMEQLRRDDRGLLRAARLILPAEDSELLLLIDQFEQVFTQVEDQSEIAHFLSSLFVAVTDPRSCLRVILTLRADVYDRPLLHRDFGNLIRQRTEVVVPLNVDELRRAIVAPAERVGVTFEPGLGATIVADVNRQPGALPMLQYALTELFERREGQRLTKNAYQAIGGVSGALTRRAEEVYALLDAAGQVVARQLFLRLVTPVEGTVMVRRRVLLSELTSITFEAEPPDREFAPPDARTDWAFDAGIPHARPAPALAPGEQAKAVDRVVEAFGKSRLLSFDHDTVTRGPTVEVAHEALLSEWQRLRDWLDDSRADLRMQRLLAAAVAEWQAAGQEASFLLQGARLEQFAAWANATALALTQAERAYLHASQSYWQRRQAEEASRRLREAEATQKLDAAERQRLQEQRDAARRLGQRNRVILVAASLTLLLALLSGFFLTVARQQAALAVSRQLAEVARRHSAVHYDQAVLLSLEALRFANTFEARDALVTILQEQAPLRQYLHGHLASVTAATFSPDGAMLASASTDGTILVWDAATGKVAGSSLVSPDGMVTDLAFTPDGSSLVSARSTGQATLWDLNTRQPLELPVASVGKVVSVAFAPDGRRLALATTNGTVFLWDVTAGQVIGQPLQTYRNSVRDVAFSTDGKWLAVGGDDNNVVIWNLETLEPLLLSGHQDSVLAVAFSPDGTQLASGGGDGAILLWELGDAAHLVSQLNQHEEPVYSLAFSTDGRRLASGSADATVVLWDLTTFQPIGRSLAGHAGAVSAVAFSPDGQTLVSGSYDDALIVWDVALRLPVHTRPITGLAFSPDSARLASASLDRTVSLWDIATGRAVGAPLMGHQAPATAVAYSPDGNTVASADGDSIIILWDVRSGQATTLAGHQKLVTSLAFSPDGRTLASASADGTLRLWEVASGQLLGELRDGHTDWIYAVAFSPDGTRLVSGSKDRTVRLWDATTRQPIGPPLTGHLDWVYSVAFSPDGKMVASGSADNTVILWDIRDIRRPRQIGPPLRAHAGYVFSVAFSPDGQTLASGSADHAVILWDVLTGQRLGKPLVSHHDDAYAVSFSPNGHWLASAGADATYRLWEVDWAARACRIVGRNLTQTEWADALQAQAARGYLIDLSYHRTCPQWPAGE
jgi:WD40 repeat protein/serine/threonine protein kinase